MQSMLTKNEPPGGHPAAMTDGLKRTCGGRYSVSTDRPFSPTLQELGDALDHAEASDPALRPRKRGAFAHPPASYEASFTNYAWLPPQHPAVRAYWRQLKAGIREHVYVEDTLRRCRKRHRLAWDHYSDLTVRRDSGAFVADFPTLRAILDARAALVESHIILQQVEASSEYRRRVEAARKRKLGNQIKLSQAQALVRALKRSIKESAAS